jgi:hypothetical protein
MPEVRQTAGLMDRLPDLTEYETDWSRRAIQLIQLGHALKQQIGAKTDESRAIEGHGLLGRLGQIEDELRLIQIERHLQGFRLGNILFRATIHDGPERLDTKQLRLELAMRGVDLFVIDDAFDAAATSGNPYWVREWKVLEST